MKVGEDVSSLPVYEREYECTDDAGAKWSLARHRGEILALFFFPRAGSPVCTKQGCAFRDQYEALRKAGAAVVGVSGDAPATNARFRAKHKMQFTLVTDADGSLRKAFGVHSLLFLPGRKTVVIDKGGRVASEYSALLRSDEHVLHAVQTVQGLQQQ